MMFSTKAEYGVRLMVELGRKHEASAVSLAEIAQEENLPLAYLEHVVARLRRAGLVTSQRGAHGGYRLARDPKEINMAEVVQALEGMIVPMECFVNPGPGGRVSCKLERDDKDCATKLLWSRALSGVIESLEQTKLSELIEFNEAHSQQVAA